MGRRRALLLIRPFVASRRGGTAAPKVTSMDLKGRRGLEGMLPAVVGARGWGAAAPPGETLARPVGDVV